MLREKFWIVGERRTLKIVISKCIVCKRYSVKHCEETSTFLPNDRVSKRFSIALEVTGIDFAGPLYLKGGDEAWICLFTCALYRCIHLYVYMFVYMCTVLLYTFRANCVFIYIWFFKSTTKIYFKTWKTKNDLQR